MCSTEVEAPVENCFLERKMPEVTSASAQKLWSCSTRSTCRRSFHVLASYPFFVLARLDNIL